VMPLPGLQSNFGVRRLTRLTLTFDLLAQKFIVEHESIDFWGQKVNGQGHTTQKPGGGIVLDFFG